MRSHVVLGEARQSHPWNSQQRRASASDLPSKHVKTPKPKEQKLNDLSWTCGPFEASMPKDKKTCWNFLYSLIDANTSCKQVSSLPRFVAGQSHGHHERGSCSPACPSFLSFFRCVEALPQLGILGQEPLAIKTTAVMFAPQPINPSDRLFRQKSLGLIGHKMACHVYNPHQTTSNHKPTDP